MSIEQEKIDIGRHNNNESTLEQYGVWVKKSPAEPFSESEEITIVEESINDDDEIGGIDLADLSLDDFNFDDPEIFSEDIDMLDENLDTIINDSIESIEDEVSVSELQETDGDTALTTEELSKITGGLIDEANTDEDDSFDIDLDDFMEIEEPVTDEVKAEDETVSNENDIIDIDLDDFMGTGETVVDEIKDEKPLDMDLSFDDNFENMTSDSPDTDEIDIDSFDIESTDSESNTVGSANFEEEATSEEEIAADDDSMDVDNLEEKTETISTEQTVGSMSTDLLNKIAAELAGLRREMSQFKSELEQIKNNRIGTPIEQTTVGGFFSDDGGDDTIALSGDELNNILTSANFTAEEKSSQEPLGEDINIDSFQDSGLSALDIQENELEEPQLDDIDFTMSGDSDAFDQLPDEIDIPVLDDLVVDSSPIDFLEDETQKEIDDSTMQYLADEPVIESLDDIEDEINADILDELHDEIEGDIGADILDELPGDIEDEINADILDELHDEIEGDTGADILDELPDDIEDDFTIDDESPEDLFSSEDSLEPDRNSPISTVFHSEQWDSNEKEELVDDIEISQELDSDDDEGVSDVGDAKPEQGGAEISYRMREEIKSVLSYMDQLLENLPEEKISEFAQSEEFTLYKKLFTELGIS